MQPMEGITLAVGIGVPWSLNAASPSKKSQPNCDKPSIYNLQATLVLLGIRCITIIITLQATGIFFYGLGPRETPQKIDHRPHQEPLFSYRIIDPTHYGAFGIKQNGNVCSLIKRPVRSASDCAVKHLFSFEGSFYGRAQRVHPTQRNELRITALLKVCLSDRSRHVEPQRLGPTSLDLGKHEHPADSDRVERPIETRKGVPLSCTEEAVVDFGWIEADQRSLIESSSVTLPSDGYSQETALTRHNDVRSHDIGTFA